MDKDRKELASAERRNFLKLAGTGSFTAALVAGAAGTLWSSEAAAQTAHRLTGQLDKAGGVKARDGRFCLAVSTFCHAAVPRRNAALCLCDLSYRFYYDVVSWNFADLSKKMDRFSARCRARTC